MFALSSLMAASGNVSRAIQDLYQRFVTLDLLGTGTNNATNNTFLDSSSNNFTITRAGNTTQGSISPFSTGAGYWSNYFDGTGDSLTVPANSAFDFSTGNYTVEFWFYKQSTANSNMFLMGSNPYFAVNASNTAYEIFLNSGSGTSINTTISLNTWNHFALVKSSNVVTVYHNGVSVGTINNSSTNGFSSQTVQISGPFTAFAGYISNLRVVKGTAVYTENFTPSTTPLTSVSGTSLLTCQSNRFIDNSSNTFAITRVGDTRVSGFGPFAPVSTYNSATMGGSLYFDGNGDYLTVPTNTAFSFGTGDFTVEGWIYKTSATNSSFIDARPNPAGATPWAFYIDANNFPYFYQGTVFTSTVAVTLNAWNHIAVTRSSGTLRIFVNGVQGYSATVTTNLDRSAGLFIGMIANTTSPSSYYAGYMSNLRIVKGTAVYTAAFTPPSTPVTAISGTSLLLNATNAGIFDSSAETVVETLGDAKISTTVSATGSIYFDGTGDYLTAPTSDTFAFGTGDFTVETWVYFNAVSGYQMLAMLGNGTDASPPAYNAWAFYLGDGNLNFNRYAPAFVGATRAWTPTTGQWYHVAVSRNGSNLRLFVDGTQLGAAFTNSTNYAVVNTNPLTIGRFQAGGGITYSTNAYLNNLRITKGFARYTANFTPTARS